MKKISLVFSLFVLITTNTLAQPAFSGISWVQWENEPLGSSTPGYANNPYDNPVISAASLPSDWSYPGYFTDLEFFNKHWEMLDESHHIGYLYDSENGDDPDDLPEINSTYGAEFKLFCDESNLYVFLRFYDKNGYADEGTRSFEILTQPTSSLRHEPTFEAASDSASAHVVAYQNMAYARVIELGGVITTFKDGFASDFGSSIGLRKELSYRDYYTAWWGVNETAEDQLALAEHYWYEDPNGTISAIFVIPFDKALGRPADPYDLTGEYIPTELGDTILFDVFAGAEKSEGRIKYAWASQKRNGYASNYYSGKVLLPDALIPPLPYVVTPIHYFENDDTKPLQASGQNLTWYQEPGGEVLTETPVPSSDQVDTLYYYVTQTIDGVESYPAEIEVIIEKSNVVIDTVHIYDTVTVYDTVKVYDTLEVYKSVTDTLVIPVLYTHLDETEVTELKVYPNPTKDELHIALEIIEDFGNHQIRIVNSGGEKVFYGMMDQSKMSLSLADLGPKGMYYLQILNDAGRIVESRKILLE